MKKLIAASVALYFCAILFGGCGITQPNPQGIPEPGNASVEPSPSDNQAEINAQATDLPSTSSDPQVVPQPGNGSSEAPLPGKKADFKAQANNPLANMEAFNFHNYYAGRLTDDDGITSDEPSNTLWLRWAKPVAIGETRWLLRSSLPVNTWPTPYPTGEDGHETGIGDFNIFAAYLLDTAPAISFGIGPQLVAPTATDDALGSEKWSAGFANVLFNGTSKKFQYGYLLTWQHSFAGNDDRPTVNMAVMQPFGMYQLGGGTYLRSSSMWSYNLENGSYSVPIGLGVGHVIKAGKTIYNLFIEPQYSILDRGPGQPEWQVMLGFNIQMF